MYNVIKYEVSDTDLLLTECPTYDCLIGGWYCANCIYFKGKNNRKVNCMKEHLRKINRLPPLK